MIVLKPEEMKRVDERASQAGYPELILMETAGRGVAEMAQRLLEGIGNKVLILAGKGNNGGDGLVAARYLDMWGYQVKIVLLGKEAEVQGNPGTNLQLCHLRGIPVEEYKGETWLLPLLKEADLLIDALLGTGSRGELREPYPEVIKAINNSGKRILAVDIPSGINGENGQVMGEGVKADYTATMAFPKLGLLLFPGREYCGLMKVVDLGVPESLAAELKPGNFILTKEEAGNLLPRRQLTGHKGTFGKVGIIGGSQGMSGAPALAGMAALRSGAGLVQVIVPGGIQATVASYCRELITVGLDKLEDVQNSLDILAAGPGMGQSESVSRIIYRLLREFEKPLVLDADGINAIKDLEYLQKRTAPLILTPHPGEMARLLGVDIKTVQQDRIGIAREFAGKYQLYLILKGAATVVALPDGRVFINTTGNEGMATAGSGDVLTGILSALLAQGLQAAEAAVLAPYLHGLAGDFAKEKLGSYSLLAGDIINNIAQALQSLSQG